MRILLVEDEQRLSAALVEIFKNHQIGVDAVYNGIDGLSYSENGSYDAIILDLMLPGMDGLTVLRNIRANKNDVPVMLLTAKDDVSDKVAGLDCGADAFPSFLVTFCCNCTCFVHFQRRVVEIPRAAADEKFKIF